MMSTHHDHTQFLVPPHPFPPFSQEPNTTNLDPNPVPPSKKKRNLPGTPDPDAEVIALSPKSLMATNRFVCEICNKGFQRDQNLQLHRRGHNLPWKLRQRSSAARKKVYICPEEGCVHHEPSRALGDLTGIKKHFSRKHGEKKWKCEKCSKRYAVQSDWKAHSKTCGTREYRCDCGTLFSRKDSFITHRAFCDALADESARLNSISAPKNLHFKNDVVTRSNNESAIINPQQPTTLVGSMLQSFVPSFGPNFNGGDQPRNHGSPTWPNQVNPSQLNDVDTMTNGKRTVQIESSSPILRLKGESLNYLDNATCRDSKPMPMSATALLQKAALMGSMTSDPGVFGSSFGLMRSPVSLVSNATTLPSCQDSTALSLDDVCTLDRVLMEVIASGRYIGSNIGVVDCGSPTIDFMGAGRGSRPVFAQELSKFASFEPIEFGAFHNNN